MVTSFLSSGVQGAQAAEVLQVRGADLVQVGDQNRSYPVRLGCVAVDASNAVAATEWLREALPRRTRVNLRPLGTMDGTLIAQVKILSSDEDLGSGLVKAGLATRRGASNAPLGCPGVASTGGR
jgi:endonuclease YncB( thermonuclease family)